MTDIGHKTTPVYLVTLKGRNRFSFKDRLYITVEDFKKKFPTAASTFQDRLKQIRKLLPGREKLVVDWSMEEVERPDLAPFENDRCLQCGVPRYRCSCYTSQVSW